MPSCLYSELPDEVNAHVARMLGEAFSLYGRSGHLHHVLFLDRASGTARDIIFALAVVAKMVRSYGGTLALVSARKDMRELVQTSGLRKYARGLYASLDAAASLSGRGNNSMSLPEHYRDIAAHGGEVRLVASEAEVRSMFFRLQDAQGKRSPDCASPPSRRGAMASRKRGIIAS